MKEENQVAGLVTMCQAAKIEVPKNSLYSCEAKVRVTIGLESIWTFG